MQNFQELDIQICGNIVHNIKKLIGITLFYFLLTNYKTMHYNRCIFHYNLPILFIRSNLLHIFTRYRFIPVIKVKLNYNLLRNYTGSPKNHYIHDSVLSISLILIAINFYGRIKNY